MYKYYIIANAEPISEPELCSLHGQNLIYNVYTLSRYDPHTGRQFLEEHVGIK